jgi:retinol dehydrogenase 13
MKLPEELQFITNGRMPQKSTSARMDGKVCVITGATSGIGYETAKRLAMGGAQLVLVCRNAEKASRVQKEIEHKYGSKTEIILANFEKLAEIGRAAREISGQFPKIHLLINNAGIHNTGRRLTTDGNEMVFQVIHLASFLLTKKLTDNLKRGAPSRIIDINSEAHRFGGLNPNDLNWSKRPYIALRAYGAAKIAQLLSAQVFAESFSGSGVTVNVMHPGEVRTNIGMNNHFLYRFYNRFILGRFLKDPVHAANAIYYLATAPELETVTGKFFNQTIEEKPASYILKDDLRHAIWERSQQLVQPYLEESL